MATQAWDAEVIEQSSTTSVPWGMSTAGLARPPARRRGVRPRTRARSVRMSRQAPRLLSNTIASRVFEEILAGLASGDEPPAHDRTRGDTRRDSSEIRDTLEAHMAAELALLRRIRERYALPRHVIDAEEALATTFRCHLFRYLHGLKGSSHVRGRLHELHTLAEIRAAVASCLEREAAYRAAAPWLKESPRSQESE